MPTVSFAPQNVLQAGFLLQWQPFDWGRKRHTSESLKYSAKQTSLTEREAEEQVILEVNARFRQLAEARALLDTSALAQELEREAMRVVTNGGTKPTNICWDGPCRATQFPLHCLRLSLQQRR